ncbi:MAG TPA: SIMPL domain-containing protein [Thermomicrobiales bacterium]|nr:SIMPL domain-containing protein [Thermomicrobiales bacterium]
MRRITVLSPVVAVVLGFMLIGAPLASAQDTAGGSSGLSVIGMGGASAPADTAIIQLTLSSSNFGGPPAVRPAEELRQDVAPIVQAIVETGIPEDQIEVIVGPYVSAYAAYYGPAVAVLRVTVDTPTIATLSDLVDAAATAADAARLVLGGVGGVYGLSDCSTVTRDAREAAIADARSKADTMADLLGVSLGDVSGARDVPQQLGVTYGPFGPTQPIDPCGDIGVAVAAASGFALPLIDTTIEPQVTIQAVVELTFDVTGTGAATPAA